MLLVIALLLAAMLAQNIVSNSRKNKIDLGQTKDDWAKLMLILNKVDSDYVDEIDHAKVTEEILPEIMSKLDPHSVYLPPTELEAADESLQGGFFGIGIQFTVPNDTAVVSNVISGGPAEKAGILSGDRIIKVDTIAIAGNGTPQDSMVRLMRGPKGTKVTIGVSRDGDPSIIPFDIIRDKIPDKSVETGIMLNDTTGFIKLSKFSKTSYFEFLKEIIELRAAGMKKLIFDLRDNTGGYLDQAVLLANEFLGKGDLVVYMEGRNRARQDIFADGKGSCKDIELAVLINESSASSSEIFAGAIQDNDRGTIYGLRSFGKGLVQEPVYFTDGSGIRLTVSRYHTPTGRCIQKPYSDDYEYDIYERYMSGEMMSADSIKVNDSLKFTTPGGKIVYGGGGIIPDVFVPLDTTRTTEYLIKCNRQSLQVKFANETCDRQRARIRSIEDMDALEKFFSGMDLKKEFTAYTKARDIVATDDEWAISGELIITQIKALIGRYTPLGDDAFYMIYKDIDNDIQAAL